tara:strand:- start:835 stop:1116 length:282 start_codon:yes stop_codon:yes gene_type:complete
MKRSGFKMKGYHYPGKSPVKGFKKFMRSVPGTLRGFMKSGHGVGTLLFGGAGMGLAAIDRWQRKRRDEKAGVDPNATQYSGGRPIISKHRGRM